MAKVTLITRTNPKTGEIDRPWQTRTAITSLPTRP
jgi:hypothetical protein